LRGASRTSRFHRQPTPLRFSEKGRMCFQGCFNGATWHSICDDGMMMHVRPSDACPHHGTATLILCCYLPFHHHGLARLGLVLRYDRGAGQQPGLTCVRKAVTRTDMGPFLDCANTHWLTPSVSGRLPEMYLSSGSIRLSGVTARQHLHCRLMGLSCIYTATP
jgi:hypothetical protein